MLLPYCGAPPLPAELWARWNLDPVLIAALVLLAALHLRAAPAQLRATALAGWSVAALALLSPLCALSVSLFAARVGQHMVLTLVAAPLIALAWPQRRDGSARAGIAAALSFFAALWMWHLPGPYDATFRSDATYWAMHATLFGSAVLLWRALLDQGADRALFVLALGGATTVQMGLLGAILTFTTRPLFAVHYATTEAWGFLPVEDQALGGLLMWVPGTAFFLVAAWRTLATILPPPAPRAA